VLQRNITGPAVGVAKLNLKEFDKSKSR